MDMSDRDRASLGAHIEAKRRREFATKSGAYRAAGLNSATWDRIEAGLPVREDRLMAAVRALWPKSEGDWHRIGWIRTIEVDEDRPAHPIVDQAGVVRQPLFGGSYEDPAYLAHIEGWLLEVAGRLEALEGRVDLVYPPVDVVVDIEDQGDDGVG